MGQEEGPGDIMRLFAEKKCVTIAAPMVRFSRLPFRHVVRSWGCDVVYTPMIMAESFVASQRARDVEMHTNAYDRPVIVQFAADSAAQFAAATELVAGKVAGVDLNCGCPQQWAIKEGIGAALLKKPDTVRDMVRQARERSGGVPISVKIRTDVDMKKTVHLVQTAEQAGASFITLHGRTVNTKPSEPVDYEAIKFIKSVAVVPLVANGDVRSLAGVEEVFERTGVNGAMAARGLLMNPAMFAGYDSTPVECVNDFVHTSFKLGTRFETIQKTLEWMTGEMLNKSDRQRLNACVSAPGLVDFLRDRGFSLQPSSRLLPLNI